MAAKQYELHGAVSMSMVLINAFQALYVWDALFQVTPVVRVCLRVYCVRVHVLRSSLPALAPLSRHVPPSGAGAGDPHNHGHHDGRFRFHAGIRGPRLGALHLHAPSPLSCRAAAPPLPPATGSAPGIFGVPLFHSMAACGTLGPQVEHDPGLSMTVVGLILALNAIGYSIFRGANSQKDAFRRDPTAPEVAHLKFMNTARG